MAHLGGGSEFEMTGSPEVPSARTRLSNPGKNKLKFSLSLASIMVSLMYCSYFGWYLVWAAHVTRSLGCSYRLEVTDW
jgi:hypothetical protein